MGFTEKFLLSTLTPLYLSSSLISSRKLHISFSLKACASLKALSQAQMLHAHSIRIGFQFQIHTATALTNVYMKLRLVQDATKVFDEIRKLKLVQDAIELFVQLEDNQLMPDSATWNLMISGFSRLGQEAEAFLFFRKMLSENILPSLKSVTSLLTACSALSTLRFGQEIHAHVPRSGISDDEFLATALVDMYMKCGKNYRD